MKAFLKAAIGFTLGRVALAAIWIIILTALWS
jgi:hypothetical protein